jgi:alkylation response protein AidB-like acyl-CoA dehydrogenase
VRWTTEDSPERAAFRVEVRTWFRTVLPAAWMDAVDAGDDDAYAAARRDAERDGWNPIGWMGTIGEAGFAAPLWPKEYGGLSGEPWAQQVVREELGRYRLPTVAPNILGVGLAGPTFIAHGNEAQKQRHLRAILTGREIWCQLFSEPGSGSDLASLGTKAVRDGDEWVVNGQKVWTTLAQLAQWGMLLARTDPDKAKHEGISYFLLDMATPGIEVRPLRQLTGSAEFNEVYFTDVRVPAADLLGTEGEGWRYARTTLANERATLSGLSLDAVAFTGGTRRNAWDTFLDALPERADPVVRQAIAAFYTTAELKDVGAARGATAGTKITNADYNQRRSAFAVDQAGMGGVAWVPGAGSADSRAQTFLRARANSIEGGTSEILRSQLAERELGLPREPEADKGLPWRSATRG